MRADDPQLDPRLADVAMCDPDRLGGVPVFRGGRVPLHTLFDYLRAGRTIDTFLDDFPGVTRLQVVRVLEVTASNLRAGPAAA